MTDSDSAGGAGWFPPFRAPMRVVAVEADAAVGIDACGRAAWRCRAAARRGITRCGASGASMSSMIMVWVNTSPSGCHSGGCSQPIIGSTSGMKWRMRSVSTRCSTPARRRGEVRILENSSRMRSGEIRSNNGAQSRSASSVSGSMVKPMRAAKRTARSRRRPSSVKRAFGIADGADDARLEIGKAADVIDDLAGFRHFEQAVDGEVPPPRVFLRSGERDRSPAGVRRGSCHRCGRWRFPRGGRRVWRSPRRSARRLRWSREKAPAPRRARRRWRCRSPPADGLTTVAHAAAGEQAPRGRRPSGGGRVRRAASRAGMVGTDFTRRAAGLIDGNHAAGQGRGGGFGKTAGFQQIHHAPCRMGRPRWSRRGIRRRRAGR